MCWMGIGIDLHNIFPFTDSQQLAQGLNVYTQISSDWIGLENHFVFSFLWRYSWSHHPFCPWLPIWQTQNAGATSLN